MATIAITFRSAAAEVAMREYPQRTQKATMRALNRALVTGKAELARLIAKDTGVKVGFVKDQLTAVEATPTRLEVRLIASLTRLPLINFGATDRRPGGVTYRLGLRGRGRAPHAFVARVTGPLPSGVVSPGHTGVFVRKGKSRLPIRQLYGPSIGGVLSKYRDQGIDAMRQTFTDRLAHELRFATTEK